MPRPRTVSGPYFKSERCFRDYETTINQLVFVFEEGKVDEVSITPPSDKSTSTFCARLKDAIRNYVIYQWDSLLFTPQRVAAMAKNLLVTYNSKEVIANFRSNLSVIVSRSESSTKQAADKIIQGVGVEGFPKQPTSITYQELLSIKNPS